MKTIISKILLAVALLTVGADSAAIKQTQNSGLRGAEVQHHRQLQTLSELQDDLAAANSLLATLQARKEQREQNGRNTANLERRIASLLEDIADIQTQIDQLTGGGDGGGGQTGELVTLAELAVRALTFEQFDELEDFEDDFGADTVTELLSRTSRSQQGFFDFFSDSMRCPLDFQTTSDTREGDQIDQLRLSVAATIGVQINEFLCPSRL